MANLYKEKIIDHYKNPRNLGELSDATHKARVSNSVCGDELTVYLKEKDGKIVEVGFKGTGCAISMAGMSMLGETLKGKTLKDLESLKHGDVLELLGMDKSSPRFKCAILSVEAVKHALAGEEDEPCDFC